MKKYFSTIVLFLSLVIVFGEKWIPINSDEPITPKIQLISSTIETSVIAVSLEGFLMDEVLTPRGAAYIIGNDNGSPLLQKGDPDLSKLTASVIIPDKALMKIEILSSSYKEFHNIDVAPSKGNFTRDIDPATVPFEYGESYETDAFYPGELAKLREPYIIRDYRGQTVIFYPFQYNPVSRTLRVYTDITIKIHKENANGINPLYRRNELTHVDKDFNTLYKRHFLNMGQTRYTPVEEEGNMLIICYGDFMPAMVPFIQWKTLIGRPVEMVDVATIGNSSAIKDFVEDYYFDNGLTYLLLVGDAAQVPTSFSNGDSDNAYSFVVGNDHYPDFFVGRFSAEDIDQVTTQVTRSVNYEKYPYFGFDWFTRSIGIASNQGPGDDNEYDYEHVRNMQLDLLAFTYTWNAEFFDGSQGGNDASGNPTSTMVADEINTGSSIILYTGHGGTTSWSTSGFSNSDVNNLVNTGMLPFIWSVACVNGNFVNSTCFGEAWLRATDNNTGEPTGAIATLMSTINQSWNPPMEGQDAMVDILVESFEDNIKRTFAGISMNGCMQMIDEYGTSGESMSDTWTCFGDPSVMVRTAFPLSLNVDYLNPVPLGTTELEVSTNSLDGLVSMTFNGEIIATAYITGGSATLTFETINSLESFDLVVTAFNFDPFIGFLDVVGEPGQVVNPSPANGQANIFPFSDLLWEDGMGGIPTEYTVYLGTDNPPTNITNGEVVYEKTYSPPVDLEYSTEYFWRIDAYNEHGTAIGQVWHFSTAREPDENFETADFTSFYWTFYGDAAWEIDDTHPFNGLFCARPGAIEDNQYSSMILELDIITALGAPVSFWKMMSSGYGDKLQFFIDGELIDEWSGLTAYCKETYMVNEGLHTFEWRYTKDEAGSGGDDCAWVDYIYFPPLAVATVNAGEDDLVCEGLTYTLNGTGMNFCYLEWSTSGTGTFDDNTILNATYFPGIEDYETGYVTLTITAHTREDVITDDMALTFDPLPDIPATPEGPVYVDLYYTTTSEYSTEGANFALQYEWYLEPDFAGAIDSEGLTCIVIWDPGFLGEAFLGVKGINECGDGPFSELLAILVDNTVGLDEEMTITSINILPNPNSGLFDVEIIADKDSFINIQIFDIIGNKVYEENHAAINCRYLNTIDLRKQNKGLYFIFINGENIKTVKKIIIK